MIPDHYRLPLLEVQKHVPQCDVFVDCGPAKPLTEAWVARDLWPDCRIVGFEPWPDHFNNLRGRYPGWLYPFAVGHTHSTVTLGHLGPDNAGRFVENEQLLHHASMVKLNDFLAEDWQAKRRIVLWADVEGSEQDVLYGSNFIRFAALVLETRDTPHCPGWPTWPALEAALAVQGYKVVAEFPTDPACGLRNIVAVPV